MCLVSGALALVFPVTVMCCPGFPGCFPESRPWVLSLGAVVIRHSLHVMSSVHDNMHDHEIRSEKRVRIQK